jgi:hypothetical protein
VFFSGIAMVAHSRMLQSLSYLQLKQAIDYICIAVSWIVCYIELMYLDIEDRLYFMHRIRWFQEPAYRCIEDIDDDNESESLFGFMKEKLQLLLLHWRIPSTLQEAQNIFSGEEAILVFFSI